MNGNHQITTHFSATLSEAMVAHSIAAESISSLIITRPSLQTRTTPNHCFLPSHQRCLKLSPIRSSSSSDSSTTDGNSAPPAQPTEITPPERSVEIKLRRSSRKRSRLKKEEYLADAGGNEITKANKFASADPSPPKKWEEMNISEKAMELYMGEKGLLFWLNKFAYASIFIMIGAWILFRFVGPSLNLYQLDAPPLSPTSVFKGSSS